MTWSTRPNRISSRDRLWLSVPLVVYILGALIFVFWGGFVGDEG